MNCKIILFFLKLYCCFLWLNVSLSAEDLIEPPIGKSLFKTVHLALQLSGRIVTDGVMVSNCAAVLAVNLNVRNLPQFIENMDCLGQYYPHSPYVEFWGNETNSGMKLIGVLNSFGNALIHVDQIVVSTLFPTQNPIETKSLLHQASDMMIRVMSGQVGGIDPNCYANANQEKTFLRAALSHGYQTAIKYDYFTNHTGHAKRMVESLLKDYSLLKPELLDRILLNHRLVLLLISCRQALKGKEREMDSILREYFEVDVLNSAKRIATDLFKRFPKVEACAEFIESNKENEFPAEKKKFSETSSAVEDVKKAVPEKPNAAIGKIPTFSPPKISHKVSSGFSHQILSFR